MADVEEIALQPRVGETTGTKVGFVLIAGLIFAAVTLLFFMSLVVAAIFNHDVPPSARFLVLIVLALGAAMSTGFLGGAAAARGDIPIPGAADKALAVSLTGGIAVLIIVLLVGYFTFIRGANEVPSQILITLPVGIPDEYKIDNLSPEAIGDVGSARTNGNKSFLYVEFRSGQKAGKIQLTYVGKNNDLEKPTFQVTSEGILKKLE